MFFQILIKTIVDFTPMLLGVLLTLAVINIFVLVVTAGEEKTKSSPHTRYSRKHRYTWDLTRDTRFINLD